MSVIFLDDFRTDDIKEVHAYVKYLSEDVQRFLHSEHKIEPVALLGALMWESFALLEGMGYDPADVANTVLANYIRVRGSDQ